MFVYSVAVLMDDPDVSGATKKSEMYIYVVQIKHFPKISKQK